MSVYERLRLVGEMVVYGIRSVAMVNCWCLAGRRGWVVQGAGLVWVGHMWVGLVDLLFGCAVGLYSFGFCLLCSG